MQKFAKPIESIVRWWWATCWQISRFDNCWYPKAQNEIHDPPPYHKYITQFHTEFRCHNFYRKSLFTLECTTHTETERMAPNVRAFGSCQISGQLFRIQNERKPIQISRWIQSIGKPQSQRVSGNSEKSKISKMIQYFNDRSTLWAQTIEMDSLSTFGWFDFKKNKIKSFNELALMWTVHFKYLRLTKFSQHLMKSRYKRVVVASASTIHWDQTTVVVALLSTVRPSFVCSLLVSYRIVVVVVVVDAFALHPNVVTSW